MSRYYKITGLEPFKGLLIEATPSADTADVEVHAIINPNMMFGDRTIKFPLPKHALFIGNDFVEAIGDPEVREYTGTSPFGEFRFEGHLRRDNLLVDYTQYENAVAVTVREKRGGEDGFRTIYAQNFFEGAETAMEAIQETMQEGGADLDDLVFALKEIHEHQGETKNG